jgi:DNA-binding GntR family transcriptional regulator
MLLPSNRVPSPDLRSTVNRPTYQRMADDLRRQILEGQLPARSRVPSRAQLSKQYGVSDRVAVEAVRVLAAEGFVEGRPGSGTYVRERPKIRRLPRRPAAKWADRAAFTAHLAGEGRTGTWRASSETTTAPPTIAERLAIEPGAEVVRTDYVFLDDDEPAMLTASWEPLAITGGTDVTFPEEGPYGGCGVAERMAAIGITVTGGTESVTARPVLNGEAHLLDVPRGAVVIVVRRTYLAGERPVETADIVVAADRYEFGYEF